jgi:predicted metal-dependent hydrolase
MISRAGLMGLFRGRSTVRESQLVVEGLTVQVIRKRIRNLNLRIYPPDGRARVTAPLSMSDDVIKEFISRKLVWIRRHADRLSRQPRYAPADILSGEIHYFMGRRCTLNLVTTGRAGCVRLADDSTIELNAGIHSTKARREQILYRWYREQISLLIPPLLERWQAGLGVSISKCSIKRMRSRWGSCNIRHRRITLNLELAKRPLHCLEYIIVHELMHLLERRHNRHFYDLMTRHLPQWRQYREELRDIPLRPEA